MVEELLGFKKKDAFKGNRWNANIVLKDKFYFSINAEDCFPIVQKSNSSFVRQGRNDLAVERKEHEKEMSILQNQRNGALDLIKNLKQQLAEKDKQIETLRKIDIDGDGLIFENNKLGEKLKERENEIAEKIKQIAELKKLVTPHVFRMVMKSEPKKETFIDGLTRLIEKKEPEKEVLK
jgi:hypothetical protein